jgi:hypothetical protein
MNRILDAYLKTEEAKKQFALIGAKTSADHQNA